MLQQGETLFQVAQRYGISVDCLAEYNDIAHSALLFVGQVICVPPEGYCSATPTQSAGVTTYIIQPGDTLPRIAVKCGTSTEELARLNGLIHPGLLFVGQVLSIPGSHCPTPSAQSAGGTTYVVQPGDTLPRIALRYGISEMSLATHNGVIAIQAGQVLRIP